MDISELPEEEQAKARLAALGIKDSMGADSIPATAESTEEMRTGSPRTPGVDEHSGKTMKKPAEYDSEPRSNPFDQALADLQEAATANTDKTRDIDR